MPESLRSLPSIALADTGRTTTRLGFGCSGLMGGITERESLRLLDTAYDAGIRHFDVAPSYGHGAAERCLGRFLRGKHAEVTITTKYGILPPRHEGALNLARKFIRPVVRQLPSVRRRVAQAATGLKVRANFSVKEAKASLDHSLQELGLERIDVWLLHEATVDDLADNVLLEFLQEQVQRRRIGTFGVGSETKRILDIWKNQSEYCHVLQFEWPGFAREAAADAGFFPGAFLVHHRVVQEFLLAISEQLERNLSLQKGWSDALDIDLSDRQNIAALLLKTALLAHPGGIVLFSSRMPAHILANVRVVADDQWNERAIRFRDLVLRMDASLPE